jgi:hypothetical protein
VLNLQAVFLRVSDNPGLRIHQHLQVLQLYDLIAGVQRPLVNTRIQVTGVIGGHHWASHRSTTVCDGG